MQFANLFISYAVYHRINATVYKHQNDSEAVEIAIDSGYVDSNIVQKIAGLIWSPTNNVKHGDRCKSLNNVQPDSRSCLLLMNYNSQTLQLK